LDSTPTTSAAATSAKYQLLASSAAVCGADISNSRRHDFRVTVVKFAIS